MVSRRLTITFGVAVLSTGLAAAGPERLIQAPVPGFKVGYTAAQGGASIREQVPAAETVERWTRMVTTQQFGGAAVRLPPEGLLQRMASGLQNSCPGGRASQIARITISGRPAAEMRADCPRNPTTGLPETFIARVIAGSTDLYVVQVAWRRVPSPADINWGRAHLNSVRLCSAGQKCP